MAKITETITFNFDDEAQQKRFHDKLKGAAPVLADLPEDIQIPLIKLKADMRYLMGRVAQDPDCAGMMADAVLENLSQLETALYRALLNQRYRVRGDGDGHYWLVPVGRDDEFETWLERSDDGEPSWLKRIDGPHRLTFADPCGE